MFVVTCNGSLAVAQKCFEGRSSVKLCHGSLACTSLNLKLFDLINKNTKIPKILLCIL